MGRGSNVTSMRSEKVIEVSEEKRYENNVSF